MKDKPYTCPSCKTDPYCQNHDHVVSSPRPAHWLLWVLLIIFTIGSCLVMTSTVAHSQTNQFISKPVGIITGVTGDVWHIHQGYNSDNTPITIQLRPKMYMIGEVIPCVIISNMGSINYRAAMPGETPMEDICIGQKWPEDEGPVIWAEPIGKVVQTGQELYRVELTDGQIVILVWNGVYGLRDGQAVHVALPEFPDGKNYYEIASPVNPYAVAGWVRSKSWIRPVTRKTR